MRKMSRSRGQCVPSAKNISYQKTKMSKSLYTTPHTGISIVELIRSLELLLQGGYRYVTLEPELQGDEESGIYVEGIEIKGEMYEK
jgi:hypothetical protein